MAPERVRGVHCGVSARGAAEGRRWCGLAAGGQVYAAGLVHICNALQTLMLGGAPGLSGAGASCTRTDGDGLGPCSLSTISYAPRQRAPWPFQKLGCSSVRP